MSNDGAMAESLRVRWFVTELIYSALFDAVQTFRAEHHTAAEYAQDYERAFKGLARFDQTGTGMRVDRTLMRAVGPHPDAALWSVLRNFARQRLLERGHQLAYSSRVYKTLMAQASPPHFRMSKVARKLGLSERTLRRRLRSEGKSYADIVDVVRSTVAQHCLAEECRTVVETARELGLTRSGFHRAFKRWTGFTPTAYRRQLAH